MIEFIENLLYCLICVAMLEFVILFGKFTIEMISGDEE